MKKSFKKAVAIIAVVALVAMLAAMFVACDNGDKGNNEAGEVRVVYYADGAAVQAALKAEQIDYGIVGEPAATAGAAKGFSIVMDIQSAYAEATGNESGFPMSSTFVKGSLASNKTFVDALFAVLEENVTYITENAESMAALLKGAGSTSAYPAASIPRCNVGVYSAASVKADVNDMLKTLNDVDSVPDSVYYDESQATEQGNGEGTLQLYVPDGAPALAVAKLIAEKDTLKVAGYTIEVNIVPANTIATYVAKGEGDIVIMPANAGANLVVKGQDYKFLCSNTRGILYMIGNEAGEISVDDLAGKTIGCIGQGAVPQYAFERILTEKGLKTEK